MTTKTPAELADDAAEAIRRLNHATIHFAPAAEGYGYAGDVDEMLANLLVLVDRLPQALRQASSWLVKEAQAGRVRHDAHFDAKDSSYQALLAVDELVEDFNDAVSHLTSAGANLRCARDLSSHLAAFDDDLADDELLEEDRS